ncbi:MAG: magnesium transporter [Halofilum sp. (in: g-proteobacteria)]|nr:magnesium transporter [Halofilum sp. (in: g-proteobacteria)]
MAEAAPADRLTDRVAAIEDLLESGTARQVERMLHALHPAEIADLLESLPRPQRMLLWAQVPAELDGEVLLEVGDDVRETLVEDMDHAELLAATEQLDVDDMADFVQSLPETVVQGVLAGMDKQNRRQLEQILSWPEDSAGGLMNVDAVTVRADVSLEVVLRYLRSRGDLPEHLDRLVVVNRYGRYLGILPVNAVLTSDPAASVSAVMDREVEPITPLMPATDVARLFEDHDLISQVVVDDDGRVLGRITIDDVVDVIREDAEHSVMSRVGLTEDEDLFAPVRQAAARRAIWLGVNLATAFLAAWVIGQFEATLQEVVALAILMPIVASMGGIAGTQTLTMVIRGQALGQITRRNTRPLLSKELAVAVANGLLWALVVAVISLAWFQNPGIAVIIGIAMIANLGIAALAGVIIPLVMRRMGIDAALAGGVVLTTVTDVTGFTVFLGLGTLFLLA